MLPKIWGVSDVHGSIGVLPVSEDGTLGEATVYDNGPGMYPLAEDRPFGPEWGLHPKHHT